MSHPTSGHILLTLLIKQIIYGLQCLFYSHLHWGRRNIHYTLLLLSHYTWCNDTWLVNKEIKVWEEWFDGLWLFHLKFLEDFRLPLGDWVNFKFLIRVFLKMFKLQLSSFHSFFAWKFEVSPSDETFGTKGGFNFLLYTSSQSMPAKQKSMFLQIDHFLFTFEPFVIFDVISTVF